MGGGQLGRMFCMAAQPPRLQGLRARSRRRQPGRRDRRAPSAGRLPRRQPRWANLPRQVRATTTEFENVPAAALDASGAAGPRRARMRLQCASPRTGSPRSASSPARGIAGGTACRDRTHADFAALDAALLPGILKTARLGYDGKGQDSVASGPRRATRWTRLGGVACVLEQRLPLATEVSCSSRAAADGAIATYPVGREHASRRHPRGHASPRGASPVELAEQARGARRAHRRGNADTSACCASSSSCSPTAAGGQRDGAASAQQRPLHDRCLRHQPVRAAGAHRWPGCRSATPRAGAGGHAQHARRPVVRRAAAHAASRPGPRCWRIRAPSCTCTARSEPRRGRKMGHLTVLAPNHAQALAAANRAALRLQLPAVA